MLDAIRQSLQVSNVLALDRDPDYQRLSYKEAFRMATLGGAKGVYLSGASSVTSTNARYSNVVLLQCWNGPTWQNDIGFTNIRKVKDVRK